MKSIIIFIIFCAALWYFKIDVRGFVDSHAEIKNSLASMTSYVTAIWNNYLAGAASFVWNNILVNIVWKSGLAPLLSQVKGG